MKLTWIEITMLTFPVVLYIIATILDQREQTKRDENQKNIERLEKEFTEKNLR